MSSQEEQFRRSHNTFMQQAYNLQHNQDKEGFQRTMKDYENQFVQNEFYLNQTQYSPQNRINNNYLPAQNTLSDNFLQQTFLSDTNSFVQYQRIVNTNNPKQMEALNQYQQSLSPYQKQYVRPNANIEFKEEDLPLQYQRFRVPKTPNNVQANQQNPLFDHDTTLFGRNVLTCCENQIQQTTPQHLKNYIDVLGGIEDTIATMESSLKLSELKNLEEKYINYYSHPLNTQNQYNNQTQVPQPIPQANPFSKKPCENLNRNIPLVQAAYPEQPHFQDIQRDELVDDNQYSFQNEKPRLNPIIEQSRKLREEKMKFLQKIK
ncbi:hypothetical protein TTHERM_00703800 (macronuclear) [Tetrahymena thermophila SB210]|uniref:Uncharacterized protein n=1 Tax=Tetrahymena thermophila (strain SB210) TaxID=312017 RepID=Q22GE3_TETTS|nr:hypothetical protein TTHERM_00703800 [Tetrahymena thermophila SB210]EAR84388.2 hypothetical protein TTHERM_00703800 [Tetrahymena thermophila SB210]|eukprot:XP_001032051.2 hypothetical protein TTHERM_00703800 [Tetrahymena thermophila SB210]